MCAPCSLQAVARSANKQLSQIRNHGTPAREVIVLALLVEGLLAPTCQPQTVWEPPVGRMPCKIDEVVFCTRHKPGGWITISQASAAESSHARSRINALSKRARMGRSPAGGRAEVRPAPHPRPGKAERPRSQRSDASGTSLTYRSMASLEWRGKMGICKLPHQVTRRAEPP